MFVSELFDKHFIFDYQKLKLLEKLFPDHEIDVSEADQINLITCRNLDSIECYYVDRLSASKIPHSIIERCFADIKKALDKEEHVNSITYQTEKLNKVGALFFLRVFERAKTEKGRKLLIEMQPIISQMKDIDRNLGK